MARKKSLEGDKCEELLAKMLVFQLYDIGLSQDRIAKVVGRARGWVTDLLRGMPKGERSNANQRKNKKAQRRSRS